EQSAQSSPPPAPAPAPAPAPQPMVVPAGATLIVKVEQALGSKTSQTGQTFLAKLEHPLSVGGKTAIPAGARISGTVVSAKAKGKIKGAGELNLALTNITGRGITYPIQTKT